MLDIDSRWLDTQRAFDSVAAEYDGVLGNNVLIQRLREQLWRVVESELPIGSRLLDLGCGTGLDAAHFAARYYEVIAIDWSTRMIDRTRARAAQSGLSDWIIAKPIGLQELYKLDGEVFDGIYSDLGPLNCAFDLDQAAESVASLLKPGGKLIVSVIGRACPWEFAYYTVRGDFKRARIRRASNSVPVNLNGEKVWTRYYAPREFFRAFQKYFDLQNYRGLSIFLPPPYLYRDRFRLIYRALGWIDDRVGAWPLFRNLGDHFLMLMTKR